MSRSYKYNSYWVELDGYEVTLDGHAHIIRVSSYMAIFPYRQRVITVYAVPNDTDSEWYRTIRRKLGDDWSTDVLESSEVEEAIFSQLPDEVLDRVLSAMDA